jgi:uncharacterized protein YggE
MFVRKFKVMQLQKVFVPVFAGLLCLGYASKAIAEDPMFRTITVTGQGEESVETSIAQVQLGVEAKGETAEEVQMQIAKLSNQVVEFLKTQDVDKLTTTGVSLQPNYDYSPDGSYVQMGYIATNTVTFDVPNEEAGSVMDRAVKAGATRIDWIYFRAGDEAIADAEKTALQEASTDAKEQADVVLDALGFKPKEVVQIQVNGAVPPYPIYKSVGDMSAMAGWSEAVPSAVEGGEQLVNASVTLMIRY